MKNLLYSLTISVLVLYSIIQGFAAGIANGLYPESPIEKLSFDKCEYPRDHDLTSTYVFQGPIKYSSATNKSMDNFNEKNIILKISNFEFLLDPVKNITKGYISIYQPNASSFINTINVQDTYTMCTNYIDNKASKQTLVYIEPLHDQCIKEINLKGTTHFNPLKIASELKEFKLQLSGIPNNINSTTESNDLKEIKGILKIGESTVSINDITMDISCVSS